MNAIRLGDRLGLRFNFAIRALPQDYFFLPFALEWERIDALDPAPLLT